MQCYNRPDVTECHHSADWVFVAELSDQYWAVVSTGMSIGVPYSGGGGSAK